LRVEHAFAEQRPFAAMTVLWFFRALFQFSKRAAGKAAKFRRSGVKLLGVVGAGRLDRLSCGAP
jgi:hypothetical protein